MNDVTARTIFSVLCLLAIIAIAVGGAIEVLRQKRGQSLLRPGQFRLRVFSSLIWIILLGSLSYAVAFLWPHDKESARKFSSLLSGSLALMLIALLLLAYDVWQISRERRLQERQFHRQLEDMARAEIERVRSPKAASSDDDSNTEKSPAEKNAAP